MDRLKCGRRPVRTQFTKTANILKEEMKKENKDYDKLHAQLAILNRLFGDLTTFDGQIKEQMLDETDLSPEAQDKEFEEIASYEETYELVIRKLDKILKPEENDNSPSETSSSRGGGAAKKAYNLPPIEMRKFSGELKDWLGFWSQFKKIDEDPDIPVIDKFQFLSQCMVEKTSAWELVDGYLQTAENYPNVISALKERFGKDELQVEVYVRALLKLVTSNVLQSEGKFDLSKLYNQLTSHLRALDSLKITSDKYSAILYPMVESCLPVSILRAWQRSNLWKTGKPEDRLNNLMTFLSQEVEGEQRILLAREGFGAQLETSSKSKDKFKKAIGKAEKEKVPTAIGLLAADEKPTCGFCDKKGHLSQDCYAAQNWSLDKKREILQKGKCCFNCLKPGHRSKDCRANLKCELCGRRHFKIMCYNNREDNNKSNTEKSEEVNDKDPEPSASLSNQTNTHDVLLQTLKVIVIGKAKKKKLVRAMIDTGSQHSYIKRELAEEMNMVPIGESSFSHALFGGAKTNLIHKKYKLYLSDPGGKYSCNFDAYDQKKICSTSASRLNDAAYLNELKSYDVFVSDYGAGAPEVQVLIGSDVIGKLLTGQLKQLSGGLTAIETKLGWTVMGKLPRQSNEPSSSMLVTSLYNNVSSISDLWELDKIGITDACEKLTKLEEDSAAKEFFMKSVSRCDDGRYQVSLPWLEGHPPLPTNRNIALKRLERATLKLQQQGMTESYDQVFREWLDMEVIEKVNMNESVSSHYLPHRPVVKMESTTTKVRPVFDASCTGSNAHDGAKVSLNQCLAKGPNLIEMIPDLLLRFREKPIGGIADIRKAFLMIKVKPEDCNFLRFLWYADKSCETIEEYRHLRVVFGVNCSPFLLAAVLEYHLGQVQAEEKEISRKILNSIYVDNVVASFDKIEDNDDFKKMSVKILADAKFDLRMWETNHDDTSGGSEQISSVLGMNWNRVSDTLFCKHEPEHENMEKITKRKILSSTARIFDPLGILSPVTLLPKIILQSTWKDKKGWDEEINVDDVKKFRKWHEQLQLLSLVAIPRWVFFGEKENWSIHTFCDASTVGYGACVYLRCENDGMVHVNLLMAKSRVAPTKPITINRLELVSCEIGTRLCETVMGALSLEVPRYFWTDSSTVIAWISRDDKYGTFVGNRVRKILDRTASSEWFHVPGHLNPADLPSRGCDAKGLLESKWWEGPIWLKSVPCLWPANKYIENEDDIQREVKKSAITTMDVHAPEMWYYPEKCRTSKYNKIIRIMAYVMRFVNSRGKNITTGPFSADEIKLAEKKIFYMVQQESFARDHKFNLSVEKDEGGLIRVKTKILLRQDEDTFKFPVVLPSYRHPVVTSLIREEHENNCHAGVQYLMGHLREKVWILQGRKSIEAVISKCVKCRKFKARNPDPIPGPLPENRVKDANPFEIVGIDLAGPLFLNDKRKVWIVLYTCAVYRAVHLDLVNSLNTEAFLSSLKKFVCRYGRPSVIYSDNGTNFCGASSMMRKLNWDKITDETSTEMIKWIFNPPAAPWWGGWWERMIRIVKELLLRVLGNRVVNHEELTLLLCEVERVINGRPLTYISEGDNLISLTPAMFLHGIREDGLPELEELDGNEFRKRFQYRRRLMEDLRIRFRREYLGTLVHRQGKLRSSSLEVGDVALIGCDNKKRLTWPLGRIQEIIPGRDGVPRVAKIKTKNGMLVRPYQRIFPLEVVDSKVDTPCDPVNEQEPGNVYRTRFGRLVKKPSWK